jgi:hypothetical protein
VSSCTLVSPQPVELWSCVSSPLLSHTPHRRSTGGSRGATQRGVRFDLGGVSQLTFWRQGWTLVWSIFVFYFVRLPLCNKYSDYIVTFISIHSVIICVVFFSAYMRCTRLCPLNPGVTLFSFCYISFIFLFKQPTLILLWAWMGCRQVSFFHGCFLGVYIWRYLFLLHHCLKVVFLMMYLAWPWCT